MLARLSRAANATAMPETPSENRVLILAGDVPLLMAATLKRFIANTPAEDISVLTVDTDDPTGYGRIVRDNHAFGAVNLTDAGDDARRRHFIFINLVCRKLRDFQKR